MVFMEPFKEVFHRDAIIATARVLAKHLPSFEEKRFVTLATRGLQLLELKQRCEQIHDALLATLPEDFPSAAKTIRAALHPACDGNAQKLGVTKDGIQGWMIMPFAEYAGRHGGGHLSIALDLLQELTMRFTSEFGIRHLWISQPQDVMKIVTTWTDHPNEHVRRLVSEGSRPRLPWGVRLPGFIADPHATLPLLEALRDDTSAYVRKSVANHLNDIAKDHPDLVLKVAARWHRGASVERQRLLRHALRNLLKQGRAEALALYDLSPPQLGKVALSLLSDAIPRGGTLEFTLRFKAKSSQRLRLDIVLHHRKANGTLTPKVFRWKDINLAAGEEHHATRRHSFRPITTRTYHPGLHRMVINANGAVIADAEFLLE
jgi:3-methyladenine DNA glycosylase AlkC